MDKLKDILLKLWNNELTIELAEREIKKLFKKETEAYVLQQVRVGNFEKGADE